MKQSQVIIIAIVALVIGFAGGFVLRPVVAPNASSRDAAMKPLPALSRGEQPSEAEATAAVRRYRAGFQTYPQASLTLGECSSDDPPGVSCMTTVVLRPGASPQNRAVGFARVHGRWEVSVMQ